MDRELAVVRELFRLVVLAIMLERGLSYVFEIRLPNKKDLWPGQKQGDKPPLVGEWLASWLKAVVTLAIAWVACRSIDLHVVGTLATPARSGDEFDYFISALIVAGGSAGAIKLFQEVLGLSKLSRDAARDALDFETQSRVARAKADNEVAQLDATRAQAERAKLELELTETQIHLAMDQADLERRKAAPRPP